MSQQRLKDSFSDEAREFVGNFIADLNAFENTGAMPLSQTDQQSASIKFDRTNSGQPGTILLAYIGGTIACDDKGDGLEPQAVDSFEELLKLHNIDPAYIQDLYPNTKFKWVKVPPPRDSGTMDEINRVDVVRDIGREAQKVIAEGETVIGIGAIHGTDSSVKTQSRIAEVNPCSPVATVMITAQDPPGTYRGDGKPNIEGALDLMHAGIAGHFTVSADEVYIPYDAAKVSDHAHKIYGSGPYGYGHFGTMDANTMTVHKGTIRPRSNDPSLMPWDNERLMHHYRNVDTRAESYKDLQTGTCLEIPADALRKEVFDKTRKAEEGKGQHRYALIESQGASNVNGARQEFLDVATEAGICSVVVSEVAGATDSSPYAAGAKSSTHVTVVSPDTIFDHTRAKFYLSAAWTEYVLEKYNVSDEAAEEIRPMLFRELYQRQRGYDSGFIPGGGNKDARIKDYNLQRWARAQESAAKPAAPEIPAQ